MDPSKCSDSVKGTDPGTATQPGHRAISCSLLQLSAQRKGGRGKKGFTTTGVPATRSVPAGFCWSHVKNVSCTAVFF